LAVAFAFVAMINALQIYLVQWSRLA
jgi:hypothetical protein